MPSDQNNDYLEARILTAPQHKLHQILLEAAIRNGRHARAAMDQGRMDQAHAFLLRSLDIVEELVAGVRGQTSDINVKLTQLYEFVYVSLVRAKLHEAPGPLVEALGILEFQRETWQLACDKLENTACSAVPPPHRADPPAAQSAQIGLSLRA
jgi:flagellar protein FliS